MHTSGCHGFDGLKLAKKNHDVYFKLRNSLFPFWSLPTSFWLVSFAFWVGHYVALATSEMYCVRVPFAACVVVLMAKYVVLVIMAKYARRYAIYMPKVDETKLWSTLDSIRLSVSRLCTSAARLQVSHIRIVAFNFAPKSNQIEPCK